MRRLASRALAALGPLSYLFQNISFWNNAHKRASSLLRAFPGMLALASSQSLPGTTCPNPAGNLIASASYVFGGNITTGPTSLTLSPLLSPGLAGTAFPLLVSGAQQWQASGSFPAGAFSTQFTVEVRLLDRSWPFRCCTRCRNVLPFCWPLGAFVL